MGAKKRALLLSCLVFSSMAMAADEINLGSAPGENAGKEKSPAASADKDKLPAGLIDAMENVKPSPAPVVPSLPPPPAAPAASTCNDPSCLGVSEADLKAEAQLKPAKEIKPPKQEAPPPAPAPAPAPLPPAPPLPPPPPPEEVLPVSDPAKTAVIRSREWAENPRALPIQGKDGRMMFTFGDSAPTIICAPLRVCDLELEPGETVQGAPHVGDAVRWKISPAVSAEGEQKVTHLIIKPTEPGLDTNLMIPTDRRTYHLRLVSSKEKYLSRIAFEYPDNVAPVWQRMMQSAKVGASSAFVATSAAASAPAPTSASQGDLPTVVVDRINFNYKVEVINGKPRFKPVRVMDDGIHTFISMNDDMPVEEAPVLVMVDADGGEQMVNYRLKGNIFTIDRMVDKVALITGTGRAQQRVEITREKKCGKRGFLGVFGKCADE